MKHILLVEPDESVGNILSHYLSADKKWTVAVARNAQDAIHAADEKRPDLIILELAIPMHNGFAFLHEFRSYSDWAEIPVIVHSHLAKEEARMSKSWKILGASEYFYKPHTSLAKLKSSVNNALSS